MITKISQLIILPILLLTNCAPTTPATAPSTLTLEEYPIDNYSIEPLQIMPSGGLTEEQVFGRREQEWKHGLPENEYYGLGYGDLWTVFGNGKLEKHRVLLDENSLLGMVSITRDGEPFFSTPEFALPPTMAETRVLTTYDNHWVLEIAKYDKTASAETVDLSVIGEIFIDGQSLNQLFGYDDAFGFQTIHGRPFYFFRRSGKVNISYDGHEIQTNYDLVRHYLCCSAGELNPKIAQNIVGFFAWRNETQYYVEAGYFGED